LQTALVFRYVCTLSSDIISHCFRYCHHTATLLN